MRGLALKLRPLRWAAQTSAFIASNLGLTAALKTGCPYPFLFCYGCPLASAGCPIGSLQHFAALQLIPFYLIGIIGLYGLFFGRAFCGWACPFGTFHDILSKPAKRKIKAIPQVKFVMLALVIILAWWTSDTIFCKFCPSGSLFAAIPAPLFYSGLGLGPFFYVHLLTLAAAIIVALIFSRFWCRYLCPFGTIGIFNKTSILTINHDASQCTGCKDCLEVCPMGIEELTAVGKSTDCILCGRCVDTCPTACLKFSRRRFSEQPVTPS
jgi:ferredoxin-type protein NapH